ncbi:RNA-binding transcriptional accessory protein [Aerococcaceae bacterium DSM 111020]|nr:RNA-binding transcriptional accessory protein [Aerococcaceae bacterium DSM 111020]
MTEQITPVSFIKQVSQTLTIPVKQVQATLDLLSEGNTIPFIARYRKEATGSLDEVQINDIHQTHEHFVQIHERKQDVTRLIDEQDKLTPELKAEIDKATTMQQIEDIYRPYKQSRRTKAMIAKEQGLEPLAEWLMNPDAEAAISPESYAEQFITEEVEDTEAALQGAHEIIAQIAGDDASFREFIRKYTRYNGQLTSQLKAKAEDPKEIYHMYYDYQEKYIDVLPHRVLALNRGEKENILTVKIEVAEEPAINYMKNQLIPKNLSEEKATIVLNAIEDGYKRFIQPSIERELRNELTTVAEEQAISVFGENLRHLLLQPPMKGKVIMGFDPAFRTGCKLAIINETGHVLDKGVIYPHKPASASQRAQAETDFIQIITKYNVDIVAIGNGTASRESEQFVSQAINDHELETQFIVVNEAGASVYSASQAARDEFPDYEVEERSAVSIARRLQDPLAELIKIDPKAIGVGQYQHDVSQKELNEQLDFVVDITVNQVGVDINTASMQLLQHVSGLSKTTAKNVIALRQEMGHFNNRLEIKEVKRLGPKTYEQAVGFLRILGGENPLDQTSIHPESYSIAEQILADHQIDIKTLGEESTTAQLSQLDATTLSEHYDTGLETIEDILKGLMNPTEDIRDGYQAPQLRSDVLSMDDLEIGMTLEGVVRNVVDFGAFVDIGVKEDGLIHISKLSKKYIKHPSQEVAVGDILQVEVISVDKEKGRIGLKRIFKSQEKSEN